MSTIVSAVARLSPEEQRQVQVAFITTDPARDTPSKLRTYLDRFDPDYVGLTGPIERIDQLAQPMDVFIKKGEKLPSGGYAVDHSTVVVAVDHGAGDLVWTGATSPADMAEDLEQDPGGTAMNPLLTDPVDPEPLRGRLAPRAAPAAGLRVRDHPGCLRRHLDRRAALGGSRGHPRADR